MGIMKFVNWFRSEPHREKYGVDHPAFKAAKETWDYQKARIEALEKAGATILAMKEKAEVQAIKAAMHVNELEERIEALEKENERLENITASGVHTCSSRCKRPACVMRRRIETLEKDYMEEKIEGDRLQARIEALEKLLDPETLARKIGDWDFTHNSDYFCFKFGGDGDNGEMLIEALEAILQETNHDHE